MNKTVQIIPCTGDWFLKPREEEVLVRVVCWALGDDGIVRGLVALSDGNEVTWVEGDLFEGHQAFEYRVQYPFGANGKYIKDEDWEFVDQTFDEEQGVSMGLWRRPKRITPPRTLHAF